MKTWIKLEKYYQGGSFTSYKYVDYTEIETEKQRNTLMENWGESTDGGHNYGYRIKLTELKKGEIPPKEWLEKAIKDAKFAMNLTPITIEQVKKKAKKLKKDIEFYESLIR